MLRIIWIWVQVHRYGDLYHLFTQCSANARPHPETKQLLHYARDVHKPNNFLSGSHGIALQLSVTIQFQVPACCTPTRRSTALYDSGCHRCPSLSSADAFRMWATSKAPHLILLSINEQSSKGSGTPVEITISAPHWDCS